MLLNGLRSSSNQSVMQDLMEYLSVRRDIGQEQMVSLESPDLRGAVKELRTLLKNIYES